MRILTTGGRGDRKCVYCHSAAAARIAQRTATLHGTSSFPIDGDTFSTAAGASAVAGPARTAGLVSTSGATNR